MLNLEGNRIIRHKSGKQEPVDYVFVYSLEYRHGDDGPRIEQETVALAQTPEYCPPGCIVTAEPKAMPLDEFFESRWWNEASHTYFYPNDLSVKVSGFCLLEDKERFIDYLNNCFRTAMEARLNKARELEHGILVSISLSTATNDIKQAGFH